MRQALLIITMMLLGLVANTLGADELPPNHTLWYDKPAMDWNRALPIGNGRLGGMVFGDVQNERIQINEETIWHGQPHGLTSVECSAPQRLQEIRELTFQNKWSEAQALFGEVMPRSSYSKYEPLGDLFLSFDHDQIRNYKRQLDLRTAICSVEYQSQGVRYKRSVFASLADDVIVIRMTADQPGKLSFSLRIEGIVDEKKPDGSFFAVEQASDNEMVMRGASQGGGHVKHRSRVRCRADGGTVAVVDNAMQVERANSVLLILSAATNFRRYDDIGGDGELEAKRLLEKAWSQDYESLRTAHLQKYQQLYDRVTLDLPTSDTSMLPTDQRIARVSSGQFDSALCALLFHFGRYLTISSSQPGTQPPNLQGIWNQDVYPAWGGKYTSNINLEMNYWPTDVVNLAECFEPFEAFVGELSETGAVCARDCYGSKGWLMGFNTDIWRNATPIGGNLSFFTTWQCSAAWMSNMLWDHYQFTGDREFLERAYPLMKGAAEFHLATMVKHPKKGYLVTCPSSSPENRHHKIEGKQWVLQPSICAGPTMDMQILRDLFLHCAQAARELERDRDFADDAMKARGQLPPTPVGSYGQIQEWLDDWDDPDDFHRHVSQLYGLYPACQINPDDTPELCQAARVTLEHRRLRSTGWSLAWKLNLYARLRDPVMAHKALLYFFNYREDGEARGYKGGVYDNLLCKHPPFQIDGNFGACAGVAEMLLQSYSEELHLLPALPEPWSSGNVKGLCARGGFEVDAAWNEGKLLSATVRSKLGGQCVVRYGEQRCRFDTQAGGSYAIQGGETLQMAEAVKY